MNDNNCGLKNSRKAASTCLLVLLAIGCGQQTSSEPTSKTPTQSNQGNLELGNGPPLDSTCLSPIKPVDVSNPTTVVGKGDPSTCTEEALDDAVSRGGIITFDCGGIATIVITSEKNLRIDIDTVIDGNGEITLDAQGGSRLFHFESPDFLRTTTTVTFQNIALINGQAWGTPIPEYPDEPPECSRGYQVDGGGAAIFVRDGILHVLNTTFQDNQAAPLGPDVAGGGIYALASLEVVIVGSQFIHNSGSNGGAIGSLNSNLTVINSTFIESASLGHDGNIWFPDCPDEEVGSGGAGGAIFIDGGYDLTHTFCGDTFSRNQGGNGAWGGALFRAADSDMQTTVIDQCTFDQNRSPLGGGALYLTNSDLVITKSTFSSNTAIIGGALQADGSVLTAENSTFSNNQTGLAWGVMALFGSQGDIRNCTFVGNQAGFSPVIPDFGDITIENSIFWNNEATRGNIDCDATSSGYGNVQWPDPGVKTPNSLSGCVWGVTQADPQLGALANNGGPTRTHLPAPSSAASQLGSGCPDSDQRNEARPDRSVCTSGSVEIK